MALTSPGVEVTIVDQSQYLPAATNSIPLFIVASAQNKTDATSTSVAAATTKANAGKLYEVTSQRDLVTLYGNPFFYNDTNGTPINGYELNEYGLLAAYSALGVTNRVYVLRADINLTELVGKASRPSGTVTDGTYWLNTSSTTWGIYQFSKSTGTFTNKLPTVITSPSQLSGGIPIPSLGNIGDYAVLANTISTYPSASAAKEYFYKTTSNVWVPLGGVEWRKDVPTVTGTTSNPTLTQGGKFNINMGGLYSTVITVNPAPSNTVADVVTAINGLGWAGLTAAVRSGKLCIFHSDNATQYLTLSQATNVGGALTPLTELGITAGSYYQPGFTYGSAAQMPLWSSQQVAPRPTGSVWMKVGAAGTGYSAVVSKYNSSTSTWRSQTLNLATSDWAMSTALDSTGGSAITAGTLYAQYNYNNEYNEGPIYLFSRSSIGATSVTGYRTNFTTSATPSKLRVQVSVPNSATLSAEYIVNVGASLTPTDFVTAWAAAGIPNTTASVTVSGSLQLSHIYGGEIVLNDYQWINGAYSSSGLLSNIGFVAGVTTGVKYGPSAAPNFYFKVNSTRSSGNYVVVDDASMLAVGDVIGFNGVLGTLDSSTEYVIVSIDTSVTPPVQFTVAKKATPAVQLGMVDAFGTIYGSKLVQSTTTGNGGVGANTQAKLLIGNNYGSYKLVGDGIAYGGSGYAIGDLITVDGASLGGASTTNDLTVKVTANNMAQFNAASGAGWNGQMFQEIATASATTATFAVFNGGIDVTTFGAPTLIVSGMASGAIVSGVTGTYIQNTDGLASPTGANPMTSQTQVIAQNAPLAIAITAIVDNTTSFTVTSTAPWVSGMQVTIAGCTPAGYNGTWTIASTDSSTQFTVTTATGGVGPGTVFGTALGLGTGGVGFYQTTVAGAVATSSQTVRQYRAVMTVTATANNTIGGAGVGIVSTPALNAQELKQLSGSGFATYGTATKIAANGTGTGALGTYYLDLPQTWGSCYIGLEPPALSLITTAAKYMYVAGAPAYGTINVAGTATVYDANGAVPAAGNGTGAAVTTAGGITFVEGTFGGKGVYGVTLAAAAISATAATDYTMPSQILTSFAMSSGVIEVGQTLSGIVTVPAPLGFGVSPAMAGPAQVVKNMFVCNISGTTLTITGLVPGYSSGQLAVGQTISGVGIAAGTTIVAMNDGWSGTYTGNGGIALGVTYKVSTSQTVTGATATASGSGTGGAGTYTIDNGQWNAPGTTILSNDGAAGAVTIYSGNAVNTTYKTQISNWVPITYTASTSAPVANPTNGTNWYHYAVNEVDIMVQKNGAWIGYKNTGYDGNGHPSTTVPNTTDAAGPIVSASQPITQSDGATALQYGDLWLDTSDLENYPKLYRWQYVNTAGTWVAIDNTDQTSAKGILFADARWAQNGTIDPVNDSMPTIVSLLTSNHLDLDAPNPSLYPQGTLLFNTRRSGYTVKKFTTNYFTATTYPNAGSYNSADDTNNANLPYVSYTWVTASGNKSNGSPYMGRKAQRAMVVKALVNAIGTNSTIRDEDNAFNLIATPGYPELQPTMVTLNNDRGNTAFIVGDTPLRLKDDATTITNWANNTAGASGTGEDGLVTRDTYLGIFYPSGVTTDLSGNTVVVPASHAMVRTFLRNDSIGYPWFAAAGTRRGTIDNLTNIGYLDAATAEFQTIKTRVGIRDTLYSNQLNPLAFFTGIGLLSYGNKSSFASSSALDRINVVRLVAYVRRQLTLAARPFIFEPNDTLTRQQILAVVQSLFADLVAKRGVYYYLVVCDTSNNTPARIDRNELWIDVAIEPVKAVEFIYIPVRILNTGELGNK